MTPIHVYLNNFLDSDGSKAWLPPRAMARCSCSCYALKHVGAGCKALLAFLQHHEGPTTRRQKLGWRPVSNSEDCQDIVVTHIVNRLFSPPEGLLRLLFEGGENWKDWPSPARLVAASLNNGFLYNMYRAPNCAEDMAYAWMSTSSMVYAHNGYRRQSLWTVMCEDLSVSQLLRAHQLAPYNVTHILQHDLDYALGSMLDPCARRHDDKPSGIHLRSNLVLLEVPRGPFLRRRNAWRVSPLPNTFADSIFTLPADWQGPVADAFRDLLSQSYESLNPEYLGCKDVAHSALADPNFPRRASFEEAYLHLLTHEASHGVLNSMRHMWKQNLNRNLLPGWCCDCRCFIKHEDIWIAQCREKELKEETKDSDEAIAYGCLVQDIDDGIDVHDVMKPHSVDTITASSHRWSKFPKLRNHGNSPDHSSTTKKTHDTCMWAQEGKSWRLVTLDIETKEPEFLVRFVKTCSGSVSSTLVPQYASKPHFPLKAGIYGVPNPERVVGVSQARKQLKQNLPDVALIFGKPGSGKSTLGRALKGWHFVDVGAERREVKYCDSDGSPRFIDNTNATKDYFDSELVNSKLKQHSKLLFDGASRHLPRKQDIWSYEPCRLRGILVLDLDTCTARERARCRWKSGERAHDYPEYYDDRLEIYERLTLPVIEAFKNHGVPVLYCNGSDEPQGLCKRAATWLASLPRGVRLPPDKILPGMVR